MKKLLIFTCTMVTFFLCSGQGFSISYATGNVAEIDFFVKEGKNRFHLGYGHQFNGQKIEIIKTPKATYGTTEIGKGNYFWIIDLGYSRIVRNRITVHSELSIGAENQFTNYQEDRFSDNGYSLITNSKLVVGMGFNLGYLIKKYYEPFIGLHTLKKVNFGIRVSF